MRAVLVCLLVLWSAPVLARELLRNGHFTSADGWWASPNLVVSGGSNGKLCVDVPAGTVNPWDASIGQDGLSLTRGEGYRLEATASADPPASVAVLLQLHQPPYTALARIADIAPTKPGHFALDFAAPADATDVQFVIQLGGQPAPYRFCLAQASVRDGVALTEAATATPAIRVNQLGYLPGGPKRATLVTDATEPVPFSVNDATGAVLFSGIGEPRGTDPTSGLKVQVLDFSALDRTGAGLTVSANGEASYPFAIAPDLYAQLRHDAFSFFYPMRSGIAIDGAIAGAAYARAAGHVSRPGGPGPNQGDDGVPCQPAHPVQGEPDSDCDYTLDASGGWYDAGDQGKYVVNGAISEAQLLLAYERDATAGGTGLGDGSLAIPEAKNGVPDALDEARWELSWMLKMIVPADKPLAGMLHSKLQDDDWTGIPTLPADDPKPRELHAPSTAATLDFAAVAAIGARDFLAIDPDFAGTLRDAARTAYAAAKAHPDRLVIAGAYEDTDLRDEFFWAAAELLLLTGDPAYRDDLVASPGWAADLYDSDGFSWQQVAPLAALELARNAPRLSAEDATLWQAKLRDGATRLLALQRSEAFGQSLTPSNGIYGWGSNAQMLANAIVMATAADLFDNSAFRNAAIEAADYLLGRNGLGQSYVTGYGTQFSRNQHSRWFAHARNPSLPNPPRGALAGGANGNLEDPVMQARFGAARCPPQLCYVDDIDAYSVNEIAINWNAGLAQLATWLALQR